MSHVCEERLLASSCLSARMEFGSQWTDYHEIFIFEQFSKSVENFQVSLTSDKNKKNGYFTSKSLYNFWSYLAKFFLEWKMFRTKAVDKTKTDILRSITFFRKLCRLLDNVKYTVMRGRSQKAIWRMRVTYWIPRTTHTHTHTLRNVIAFPKQQWCTNAPRC